MSDHGLLATRLLENVDQTSSSSSSVGADPVDLPDTSPERSDLKRSGNATDCSSSNKKSKPNDDALENSDDGSEDDGSEDEDDDGSSPSSSIDESEDELDHFSTGAFG